MFKKYRMVWVDTGKHVIDFYVHSKKTRCGFMHRACVIGVLPRLDDMGDWATYNENDRKLFEKRVAKVSYLNRSWESYAGQTCLARLWDQLDKLKFVDMSQISKPNPFKGEYEPQYESLREPDELFDGFKRR